jgi:hypothetical protein
VDHAEERPAISVQAFSTQTLRSDPSPEPPRAVGTFGSLAWLHKADIITLAVQVKALA